MTERDDQQARVYAAESLVCRIYDRAERGDNRSVHTNGSTIMLPIERRFASIESIQQYLHMVQSLRWVRAAWPERAGVPLTVRPRHGQTRAHYERLTATIAIPPYHRNHAWAMRELVVLHEPAHHLAADLTRAAHGPEFVDRLTVLLGEIIGPEAGLLMRTAMDESNVRLHRSTGVQL